MKSPVNTSRPIAIVAEMLSELSNIWLVTPERVSLLKAYRSRVPPAYRSIIDRMLDTVSAGSRYWSCQAEYMAALQQISFINQQPGEHDVRTVLNIAREGAQADGVIHSDWVKEVLKLLERMIQYGSVAAQAPPIEEDSF